MWLYIGILGVIFFAFFCYILTDNLSVWECLACGVVMHIVVIMVVGVFYSFRNTDNADYEYTYARKAYCHLTHLNYNDERQMIIEAYQFPDRTEYKFSKHTYYRIDVTSSTNGLISYWVKDDKLKIEVIDGTIPAFQRITQRYDKNHNKFCDYILPKFLMNESVSKPMGILYLPKEPVIVYGEIPPFLELDFLKYLHSDETI